MAAPHVAGAWAVYKQANPTATVDEALAGFVDSGVLISDWRGGSTKPRISVAAAVGLGLPVPTLDSVSPASVNAYGPAFTLTVNGSGFVPASRIKVNGSTHSTTYLSDTVLTAQVAASTIATLNPTLAVTVFTPAPGGGTSNAMTVDILPLPEPEPGSATLTVDTTTAAPGDPVTVTFQGSPSGATDWLAFAKVGNPANSYVQFLYVGAGVSDRTWTVNMPATEGDYEFRLFLNNGYTVFATSPTVTVGTIAPEPDPDPDPGSATLTIDTTNAAPGDPVTLTLEGSPGGGTDWLAFAKVGNPANSYVQFVYVGAGVTDRTWTVNMPATDGEYEFRLFLNNGYTVFATSPTVTVGTIAPEPDPDPDPGSATLTIDTATAAPGDPVTLTLEGSPGGGTDWLAFAKVGNPANSYVQFVYVGAGVTDRTWTVNMPATEGDYEFRLFLDNGYTVFATSPTVTVGTIVPDPDPDPDPGSATLTIDTMIAAPGDPVTVTLQGSPGGGTDWLAFAKVGNPANSYVQFVYVGAGVTDRTWTVNMPATDGEYEFRLFLDNGYTVFATSPTVTVGTIAPEPDPDPDPGSATLTIDTMIAAPGDPVTVTLQGSPGGGTDWLAFAKVGNPATSYVHFVYVGASVTDRTWTVNMPATVGEYEFRLFLNNGYTVFAVSPPVSSE